MPPGEFLSAIEECVDATQASTRRGAKVVGHGLRATCGLQVAELPIAGTSRQEQAAALSISPLASREEHADDSCNSHPHAIACPVDHRHLARLPARACAERARRRART